MRLAVVAFRAKLCKKFRHAPSPFSHQERNSNLSGLIQD